MFFFFFFKQKTAYEMRISDWSSDVCSSDLSSTPAANATMAKSNRVVLAFNEKLVAKFSGAEIVMTGMPGMPNHGPMKISGVTSQEIGRASCRERGCQYV